METAFKGDVAILRAWKVDEDGNCQFGECSTNPRTPADLVVNEVATRQRPLDLSWQRQHGAQL